MKLNTYTFQLNTKIICSLFLFFFFFGISNSYADYPNMDSVNAKFYATDTRPWLIEIPIWVPGFRGQLAYGDFDFFAGDKESKEHKRINSKLGIEFYFNGRFVYQRKKLWIQLDAFSGAVSNTFQYTSLIGNNTSELVKLTSHGTIPRLSAGYSVFSYQKNHRFKFDVIPYIGLRYVNIRIKSDIFNHDDVIDVRPSWLEPVIGLYLPISYQRFRMVIQTDIGGSNRKNTWAINHHFHYRISKLIDVRLGWTLVNLHYREQFLNEDLYFNIRLLGPTAGVGFRF